MQSAVVKGIFLSIPQNRRQKNISQLFSFNKIFIFFNYFLFAVAALAYLFSRKYRSLPSFSNRRKLEQWFFMAFNCIYSRCFFKGNHLLFICTCSRKVKKRAALKWLWLVIKLLINSAAKSTREFHKLILSLIVTMLGYPWFGKRPHVDRSITFYAHLQLFTTKDFAIEFFSQHFFLFSRVERAFIRFKFAFCVFHKAIKNSKNLRFN